MATNVKILCSINVNNGDIESWQNMLAGDAITDELSLTMSTDKIDSGKQQVAAATKATVWDKDDSHQVTTINLFWFLSDKDGILGLHTTDEADSSDLNQIPVKAGVPILLIADAVAGSMNGAMKLFGDYTYATWSAGTLEAVTKIEFFNSNTTDLATFERIICK